MKWRIQIVSYSRRAKWIVYPATGLVMLNFFAFVLGSTYLGGDALNGQHQAGHYFVCAHGHCTEVSKAVWQYSYWHAYAAIGGFISLFAVIAFFINSGDIEWKQQVR
jgi:hypothetical protein